MQYGQVIYSSGGKIYMLLPNTRDTKKRLKELHEDFEKSLWGRTQKWHIPLHGI
jgi:CRISPR/Cas system-associated protein Cas10 (large subunit of type III CRISPR-Cas system)